MKLARVVDKGWPYDHLLYCKGGWPYPSIASRVIMQSPPLLWEVIVEWLSNPAPSNCRKGDHTTTPPPIEGMAAQPPLQHLDGCGHPFLQLRKALSRGHSLSATLANFIHHLVCVPPHLCFCEKYILNPWTITHFALLPQNLKSDT
jgi:hypothetical protein